MHVQRLKFLVWKPRLGSASNSYNTGNFHHTTLPRSVHSRHSVSLDQCFPFQTSFSIFTYPNPTIQQINIAWLMMWSTLHVSLYCKALCITTMGDERRGREKRGILKCSVVFNASNKKKKSSISFCSTK